jgi:hypothetical protein
MSRKSTGRVTQKRKLDSRGRAMPEHRKAVIEVWKNPRDKKFYFHLRSSNGKVVVNNKQGYERRVSLVETLDAMINVFKEGRFQIVETA